MENYNSKEWKAIRKWHKSNVNSMRKDFNNKIKESILTLENNSVEPFIPIDRNSLLGKIIYKR